jgi:hypothetical protein
MLAPQPDNLAPLPATQQPLLVAVIDTEEEFDWGKPFARSNVGVAHIRHQDRAQAIFGRFGLRPLYAIDYPVAENEQGFAPLREWAQAGTCEIGTHLHPWVNPPFEEHVDNRNSYPGNLPAPLERAKLSRLTDLIEQRFGARPVVYRAGRYGVGANTAATLSALGYQIDTSVVPRTNFSAEDGPDFTRCGIDPYWIDAHGGLLEIPLTVGWTGALAGAGAALQPVCRSGWGQKLRLQGILARAGLFERIRLTPEGMSVDEMCRLTRALLARGLRIFNFTYHSPSLMPGHTPYVRSEAELQAFLGAIERYLEFFFGEIGGRAATMREIRALCLNSSRPAERPSLAAARHADAPGIQSVPK